jgi:hypothetical protein
VSGTSSAIAEKSNQYTKIGNLVTFTVNYLVNIEYIYLATGAAPLPIDIGGGGGGATSTYAGDSFEAPLGIRLPFPPKANSPINARGIVLGDSAAIGSIEVAQIGDADPAGYHIAALSWLDADGLSSALSPYTPGAAVSIGLGGSPSPTIQLQMAITISYFAAD